jgi:hypothetical protein
MSVTAMKAKSAVESLRDIVQDLLVPDMKAIRVEVESHRRETKAEFDSVRNEMKISFDSIRTELRLRDEKQSQAIQALSDKIGYALDIRERLAVLEDRGKRPS